MSGGKAVTRVTIVGSGTSAPQPETPASGTLVETASTAILIDCGPGVIRAMMPIRDPRNLDAIVIGHFHADHYIDIVSLRYLLPWAGFTGHRMPLLLPPGGRARMDELAAAISEFGSATNTTDTAGRARALRRVAENPTFASQELSRAFVLMEYFGYLQRNPNDIPDTDYRGYDFWVAKLNQFNGNFQNADMVKAFISSNEYRKRFGP